MRHERAARVTHASGAGLGPPASARLRPGSGEVSPKRVARRRKRVGQSEQRSPSGMTRREFLATTAAPILLGVQDKAGTKRPVLGSGPYTYEAIHDWGRLPASIAWGNTHGVVEDAQRRIYVHHTVHTTSESAD